MKKQNIKMTMQSILGGSVAEVTDEKKKGKSAKVSCENCPLNGKTKVIDPPKVAASILIVGEAPGKEEEAQGKRFVGKSGQLLRSCLDRVGISVDKDVQFTNVCNCRPSNERGDNRTPEGKEIGVCSKLYLARDIERFKHIIVVGKTAEEAVLGETNSFARGNVVWHGEKRVAVTHHPASILRNPNAADEYVMDFRFFKSVFIDDYEPKYTLVDSIETRNALYASVLKLKIVVVDIETTGLEVTDQITLVGFCTNDGAFVVPIIGKFMENIEVVKKCLSVKDITYVPHNATFEYKMLNSNGLCDSRIHYDDTMINAYLITQGKGRAGYKLKSVAVEFGFRWANLVLNPATEQDFKKLCAYNAEDLINTWKLYFEQKEMMSKNGLANVAKKVTAPAIPIIGDMERYGVKINVAGLDVIRKRLTKQISILTEELTDKFGERNWNSTKQLQEIFAGLLDTEDVKKTPGGKISTDEGALKACLERCDSNEKLPSRENIIFICERLLKLRGASKLLGTYVEGLTKRLSSDGRLRGNFSLIGTATGRLSSFDPNLQNIPRGSIIKSIFVAEDGYSLIEADLSQIELRVVASIAPEQVMIDAYNRGTDLHRLTASLVSGVPLEQITKEQRQTAKSINFGLIYGMSWQGYKAYAKNEYDIILTNEQAQQFRQTFFEKYPGIREWHLEVETKMRHGMNEVRTVMGRIRYLKDEEFLPGFSGEQELGHKIRQALNTPVQSAASDLNLQAMRVIWEKIDSSYCRFLLTVHDEFMLECRDDKIQEVLALIKESAQQVQKNNDWLKVPFIFDVKVGKSWSELKEVE